MSLTKSERSKLAGEIAQYYVDDLPLFRDLLFDIIENYITKNWKRKTSSYLKFKKIIFDIIKKYIVKNWDDMGILDVLDSFDLSKKP